MNNMSKISLALAAAVFMTAPVQTSFAQASDESSLALEEIVVSARKRDEALQSVPIAVSVFSADRLEQLSIRTVENLARFSSGLTFDQGVLPSDTRPVIRGVTSQRGRPNVGVLVDFVDVSSESLTVAGGGITTNIRLLDLERVEIVKGPQTALYGRSAFTGAINYVTKRPGDEFESEVTLGWDENDTQEVRLSVGGPLIADKLNGRAIFSKYDSDGWYTNPNTGGNLGSTDSIGGALGFEWQISDRTSTFFRVERSTDKHKQRAEILLPSISPVSAPANFLGTGTVTDNAIMVPYEYQGEVCNTPVDRMFPYWDSFDFGMGPMGPACRPIINGEMRADASMIDLAPDPRTGNDFNGSEINTTRYHLDFNVDFGNKDFTWILGYLDNNSHIQEDFTKNSTSISSTFVPFPPPGMATSQFGLSAMAEQRLETTQFNNELRLSGETGRTDWMLSLLNWEEEMELAFDDEWWLRTGGATGPILDILNAGPFSYLQGIPPFVPPFCTVFYPTDPSCVNAVTTMATGPGNTPAIPITRKTSHWSMAAMASVDMGERAVLTLEGRYIKEDIDYTGDSADVSFFSLFGADPYWGFQFGPGEATSNSVNASRFIPKVTLDFNISDDLMLYGYFSKAFKPGGIATTDANGDVRDGEYKSEKLDVYEVGFKSTFRDRSIRWNSAVYFYDYTDQQVPFQTPSASTGLLQTFIVNAGKTEITGFETDIVWRSAFIDGLSVSLGYTHSNAEFTDFNLANILAPFGVTPSAFNRAKAGNADADFTGKVPALTAENAGTASVRYDFNIGASMWGFAEVFASYMDDRFISEGNRSYLPAHTVVDLYTGVGNDAWSLSLYVENLADDDKIKSGLGNVDFTLLPDGQSLSQAATLYLPQPRTVGARFSYSFGN
jgi:outer membrane receptor protein involved in Fe transport